MRAYRPPWNWWVRSQGRHGSLRQTWHRQWHCGQHGIWHKFGMWLEYEIVYGAPAMYIRFNDTNGPSAHRTGLSGPWILPVVEPELKKKSPPPQAIAISVLTVAVSTSSLFLFTIVGDCFQRALRGPQHIGLWFPCVLQPSLSTSFMIAPITYR